MTVHLLGLPHTETTKWWSHCAFTQKIISLATMLGQADRDVIVYSGEHNEAPCKEHVVVTTEADRRRWFGDETYADTVFDRWNLDAPCWTEMSGRMVDAIKERAEPGDVVSLTMGLAHKAIADCLPDLRSVELGVGYEASFAPFRVFESYAWMHHTYGRQSINDGRYFDAVIPNAVDPLDFSYETDKDDYLLFLGRHIDRKGIAVVQEIAKHHKVFTAGQGGPIPNVDYLGVVRGSERAELIACARALLAPTHYIGPWEGVVVEAQVSGTPVITTDWGAFTENVSDGLSGYRCRTLGDFLWAVDHLDNLLPPWDIANNALARWSMQAVAPAYDRYLDHLSLLDHEGWYSQKPLRRG